MKCIQIGLKIWSTNRNYLDAVHKLYKEKYFDYIELFVEPRSLPEHLQMWQDVHIPYLLHAPHSAQGLNFGANANEDQNRSLIAKVAIFEQGLDVSKIIFHPGTNGSINETIRQIGVFKSEFPEVFSNVVIENKPKVGLNNEDCLGASPEEIKKIKEKTGLGFCFDISHAMCFAAWAKKEGQQVLDEFLRLQPDMFHICDGETKSVYDQHFHLGEGDYDLKSMLSLLPNNSLVSIETQKSSKENLDDFKRDVDYLRTYLNGN